MSEQGNVGYGADIPREPDMTGYFDWAATSPPDPAVYAEMTEFALSAYANPSSAHAGGTKAKDVLSQARSRCAAALEVNPDTLFFTSGGTEADHIPLLSLLQRPAAGSIVISAIEHPAIREQARMIKHCGWDIIEVRPGRDGIVQPDDVAARIREDTALVCVMAVNNETGAVQPVRGIADMIASLGSKRPKFHVDAVQAAGKIPFSPAQCGIDTAAFSAHKIRGPRGVGLLYMARRQEPFIRGGGQENGIRPGTENTAGAWALSRCMEKYAIPAGGASRQDGSFAAGTRLCAALVSFLRTLPGCKILPECRENADTRFSPWIIQASFRGIPGEVAVRALSEKGFFISTGSACSSRKQSRPVLEAMGVSAEDAACAVRFSFGPETSGRDADRLCEALSEMTDRFSHGKHI